MELDAHCEMTPSASRTHLMMLYTVVPGNAMLRRDALQEMTLI
jgi:hypothetical protein